MTQTQTQQQSPLDAATAEMSRQRATLAKVRAEISAAENELDRLGRNPNETQDEAAARYLTGAPINGASVNRGEAMAELNRKLGVLRAAERQQRIIAKRAELAALHAAHLEHAPKRRALTHKAIRALISVVATEAEWEAIRRDLRARAGGIDLAPFLESAGLGAAAHALRAALLVADLREEDVAQLADQAWPTVKARLEAVGLLFDRHGRPFAGVRAEPPRRPQ